MNTNPIIYWLRNSLFSSPFNTILTLVCAYLLYQIIPYMLSWAVFSPDATNWFAGSASECNDSGACWGFVGTNILNIFYGFYPQDEIWRPNVSLLLLIVLLIPLFIKKAPYKTAVVVFILAIYPFIAFAIIHGSLFGIQFFDNVVDTDRWGGFMLTIILSGIGIIASLPIGIVLALGRRSTDMPLIKNICIIFIEFWRGVPLITVLFMSSVMLPLFLPEGSHFDKLARALIGITLFQSAYMAEVIRGGLQAIPTGQYEAADSLGLGYWLKTLLIILPQALKLVIPGIVNTFIELFKDTSLVSIIGMMDLLNMSYASTRATTWLAHDVSLEGFIFVAMVYWVCCYSMSKYSQHIERTLSTTH